MKREFVVRHRPGGQLPVQQVQGAQRAMHWAGEATAPGIGDADAPDVAVRAHRMSATCEGTSFGEVRTHRFSNVRAIDSAGVSQ